MSRLLLGVAPACWCPPKRPLPSAVDGRWLASLITNPLRPTKLSPSRTSPRAERSNARSLIRRLPPKESPGEPSGERQRPSMQRQPEKDASRDPATTIAQPPSHCHLD